MSSNAAVVQAAIAAKFAELELIAGEVEEAGAALVATQAEADAPVDTGELRGSIVATGNEVRASAGHAGYQEYGTTYVGPQPFMRPAVEASEGPYWTTAQRIFSAVLI